MMVSIRIMNDPNSRALARCAARGQTEQTNSIACAAAAAAAAPAGDEPESAMTGLVQPGPKFVSAWQTGSGPTHARQS